MNNNDKIESLIDWLHHIAKPVYESSEHPRWIGARNADHDQSFEYCYDCCESEVNKLNAEHPDHEYFIDGGYGSFGEDVPPSCEDCGKDLDATLSAYGVREELDHYMNNRIRLRGKCAPREAFRLIMVLESSPNLEKDDSRVELKKLIRRLDAIRNLRTALEKK